MSSMLLTPDSVITFVEVAADCEVIRLVEGAPPALLNAMLPGRSYIRMAAGVEVSDRGHLRTLLSQMPPHDPVEFVIGDYMAGSISHSINIENSVECNGVPSQLAPQKDDSDEEELGEPEPLSENEAEPSVEDTHQQPVEPTLVAFEKIDPNHVHQNTTTREKLMGAVGKVEKGRCVVVVTSAVSPHAEIQSIAEESNQPVTVLNCGLKLRHRPTNQVLAELFANAMRQGHWFLVLAGHKSIASMRVMESLLVEMHERNLADVAPASKIIICTESHPHFPRFLTKHCVPLKISQSFSQSKFMHDTMMSSQSFMKLVAGESVSANFNFNKAGGAAPAPAAGSGGKKKVRISPAVDIVDIAPRDIVKVKQKATPVDVSGSVALQATFAGLPNDKFLSVVAIPENGGYAIGSSLGNVYFIDDQGNGTSELHAHDGSVWDLSFSSMKSFATGSEDGQCIQWGQVSDHEGLTVQETHKNSLGADIYCVHHLHRNQYNSPILVGGLSHNLMVVREGGVQTSIKSSSSIQALSSLFNCNSAVVGSGDGSVKLIDVEAETIIESYNDHQRKVPTLSVNDQNIFFTGSFDCTIRAWDARATRSASCSHTLKLKNYITGVDVDGYHLAASVADNLYLWDVRKLNEVLGGFPQGWKGLSRGIRVNSDQHQVVTASPDGFCRLWKFH